METTETRVGAKIRAIINGGRMVYILADGFIHAERTAKQYGLTEWRFVVTERDLSEANPTRDTVIRGDTFFPRWVPNYSAIVAELTVRGFQWSEA